MKPYSSFILFTACISALIGAGSPAGAQYVDQSQKLNRMLNAVDNPVGWSNTPVSGAHAPQTGGNFPGGSNVSGTFMNKGMQPWNAPHAAVPAVKTGQPAWSQTPAQTGNAPGRMFTRQEIMRVMMEGGGGGGGGWGGGAAQQGYDSAASGNTYSNYQTAMNQQQRAYNFSQQARYGKDSWSRKNYASQARYAANAARAAADRAYQSSLNGDQSARGYAAKARDAANRANADANRAEYNANINN